MRNRCVKLPKERRVHHTLSSAGGSVQRKTMPTPALLSARMEQLFNSDWAQVGAICRLAAWAMADYSFKLSKFGLSTSGDPSTDPQSPLSYVLHLPLSSRPGFSPKGVVAKIRISPCEDYEALAQRNCGCLTSGSVKSQAGQGLEQP